MRERRTYDATIYLHYIVRIQSFKNRYFKLKNQGEGYPEVEIIYKFDNSSSIHVFQRFETDDDHVAQTNNNLSFIYLPRKYLYDLDSSFRTAIEA